MNIHFKNPPIHELIIGVFLDTPVKSFRSEHIGLLWSQFRSEFPTVLQREPIWLGDKGIQLELMGDGNIFPMPRFWFISEDDIKLIQVQKNAFILNWRKQQNEYPRFNEHLKPCFDEKFEIFKDFLGTEFGMSEVKISHCELTYTDMIKPCEYWCGPQDTSKVIPFFSMPPIESTDGAVADFSCTYHQDIDSHLQLYITIRTAELAGGSADKCLLLDFKAVGQPTGSSKSNVDEWFSQAHNRIINQFLSMTDKSVQQNFWLLTEGVE